MQSRKGRTQGFTLIVSLLLLLLMSGIAIGMLMMVNTEGQVGTHDLENNLAYRSAEGAMEKMASDINTKYSAMLSPTYTDITGLASLKPTNDSSVTYPDYSVTPHTNSDGTLQTGWGKISSGNYKDLYAQIQQIDLLATAKRPLGDEVSMMRTVEVAMIPVFQFGVFSDSDLGFFSSPDLDFAGRVHTNGNLFLGVANCCTITFHDKMTAYGEVIRKQLPNGLDSSSNNNTGTVDILTSSGGCDGSQPNCRSMALTEGSVQTGPTSAYNSGPPSWGTISLGSSYYNGWIINGNWGGSNGTGVKQLTLPFVGGGAQPYEIIRRPIANETSTSTIGASRLYNEAEIRVLLSDDPADLCLGDSYCSANDGGNIRLANVSNTGTGGPDYSKGVPAGVPSTMAALSGSAKYMTYFAEGSTAIPDQTSCGSNCGTKTNLPPDWPTPPADAASGYTTFPSQTPQAPKLVNNGAGANITIDSATPSTYPYFTAPAASATSTWNLLDGYIRVEIRKSDGTYTPVTKEWLELGFARGLTSPSGAGTNPINPYAILLFQVPADRNADGTLDKTGVAAACSSTTSHGHTTTTCTSGKPPEVQTDASSSAYYGSSANTTSVTRTNWYPINFYDAREGEVRDKVLSGDQSCAVAGMMNSVDLDVANLKYWLANSTTGKTADYKGQNGYILFFSDRRGMLKNPNGTPSDTTNTTNTKTGDSGLEDSINSSVTDGTPDGSLDTIPTGKTYSPEDVNLNKKLDNWGGNNLGLGFGLNNTIAANTAKPNPYVRIPDPNCPITGRKNWVSGARHVLKLIDAGLNLPTKPDGTGGFTVASENPVYIQGNYNTNSSDPTWTSSTASDPTGHAAAAVIADAVTLLSNQWSELTSLNNPSDANSGPRPAVTTYYRTAIAAGKNVNFPSPSFSTSTTYGFGTDGGLHNFLRFLEDWSNDKLYYKGSLVSLYYSTYATGTFKCCAYSVYQPPDRNYTFDSDFATPSGLPPGTPMFRDVENLTYHQVFTARTQ